MLSGAAYWLRLFYLWTRKTRMQLRGLTTFVVGRMRSKATSKASDRSVRPTWAVPGSKATDRSVRPTRATPRSKATDPSAALRASRGVRPTRARRKGSTYRRLPMRTQSGKEKSSRPRFWPGFASSGSRCASRGETASATILWWIGAKDSGACR